MPTGDRGLVDRHTGEETLQVRTVADAYHEARETGDVAYALETLEKRLAQFPEHEVLLRLKAVLETEFLAPDAPPPQRHPNAASIRAEQARAAEIRSEIRRRAHERMDKESLLGLLVALEADESQADAVESYFEPLLRLHRDPDPEAPMGADERAIRTENPEEYLAIAGLFRGRERTRARMRWLLRAYATSPDCFEPLFEAYLEHGRQHEAFLVLGTKLQRDPENLKLWEWRAKIAAWIAQPTAEIEARLVLLAQDDNLETRRRLVELYMHVGRPGEAIPHALVLTRNSKDKEEQELPVRLALQAGKVDLAFDLLTELANASDDPIHWRERIIAYAEQDMRVDRVISELRWLNERYPEGDYERRLESVLRGQDRLEELADLLAARLERDPGNLKLEDEVLALHLVLGREQKVRTMILRRLDRNRDPLRFFEDLKVYRAIGVPDLIPRARSMAASPLLTRKDVGFVLNTLRELPEPWQDVAALVARRFVDEPEARAYLIARIDALPNDAERAKAAERLARDYPDDESLLKAWVERASWAGEVEPLIRARERWAERRPDDLENRVALANLYSAADRAADAVEQWRYLVGREGLDSDATLKLIDSLFAAGEMDEAIEWLEKRAALPGATVQEKLDVAEQLFGNERLDRALHFYMVVLEREPEHPLALLRAGQIRSWTNDPRGAIPFFEKRLEVSKDAEAEVLFYLGEAYAAILEHDIARRLHERALPMLVDGTTAQEVMRAKILARLGRVQEATPIFEKLMRAHPSDVHLLLDYVDAMVAAGDAERARTLTDRAKSIAPRKARVMRTDGRVALLERRFEDAVAIIEDTLRLHGPEAGTESELGRANELAGAPRSAHDAYVRSLRLQPRNRNMEQAVLRTWDRIAALVHADLEVRRTGLDTTFGAWVAGSKLLDNERTRLAGAAGIAYYDGEGFETETVARLQLSAFHAFHRLNRISGGIELYPGAPGDAPVGGWFELRLQGFEPHRVFGARVNLHTLFDDPAGAVSLGGRSTGVSLFAQGDLGRRLWGVLDLKYSSLSIETPDITNGRFDGAVSIGYRLVEGDTRVGERFDADNAQLPGLVGPDLQGSPARTQGPLVSVWATYQAIRLLDDRQLATVLPIGTSFNYLSLGGRADFHLRPGLGLKLEGYVGTDLEQAEPFFGLETALSWRPSRNLEFTGLAAYGNALGRADDADTFVLRFHFTYRW